MSGRRQEEFIWIYHIVPRTSHLFPPMDCSHQPPLGMKKPAEIRKGPGQVSPLLSPGDRKRKTSTDNCKESAVTYPLHLKTIWEPFGNHLGTIWEPFGNRLTLIVFFMWKKVTLTLNPLNCMILAACHWEVIETQIISISGAGATAGEPDKLPQDGGSLVAMEHLYLVRAAEQQTSARSRESTDDFCGRNKFAPCTLRTQRFRKTLQWKKNSDSSSTFDEVKMECWFCHTTHIERHNRFY